MPPIGQDWPAILLPPSGMPCALLFERFLHVIDRIPDVSRAVVTGDTRRKPLSEPSFTDCLNVTEKPCIIKRVWIFFPAFRPFPGGSGFRQLGQCFTDGRMAAVLEQVYFERRMSHEKAVRFGHGLQIARWQSWSKSCTSLKLFRLDLSRCPIARRTRRARLD